MIQKDKGGQMRFVAFNIDGGYTELHKKGEDEAETVENCQLLFDSDAKDLDAFERQLKRAYEDYDIGSVLVLRIDESFEPVYINI